MLGGLESGRERERVLVALLFDSDGKKTITKEKFMYIFHLNGNSTVLNSLKPPFIVICYYAYLHFLSSAIFPSVYVCVCSRSGSKISSFSACVCVLLPSFIYIVVVAATVRIYISISLGERR